MIKRKFEDFLSKKGVGYDPLKKGLLRFQYQGFNFLFECFPDDQQYFRILLPIIDTYSEDRTKILNIMNNSYKVGKFIVVQGNIWISAESFVYSTLDIDKLFDRLISLLISMINEYRQKKYIERGQS